MSHLIVFGSIGFIVVAFITSCLILWALDHALSKEYKDNGGGLIATAFVVGFVLLYYFFGSKDHVKSIVLYFAENPITIFWCLLGYFGSGVIWAFLKWYFYLHKRVAKELENSKNAYVSEHTTVSIPTASENKWRIMSWMMYWPFSALWTVIDQPIKNIFNYIFIKFEGLFNKISKSMYKDVVKNLEAKKEVIREQERKKQEEREKREKQLQEMEGKLNES